MLSNALGFTPVEPPTGPGHHAGSHPAMCWWWELFNPVYTRTFGEGGEELLTYEAIVLNMGMARRTPRMCCSGRRRAPGLTTSLFIDDCADIGGCYTGGFWGLSYAGEIPGGPFGRCYSWSDRMCMPCETHDAYYNNICNNAFPRIQGTRTTNTCGPLWC